MSRDFLHLPAESWRLLLDDELDDAARERVEHHLDECEACRAVLEAEDPTRIFARLRDVPAPPETWDGFWEAMADSPVREAVARLRERF